MSSLTPMFEQYQRIKQEHADAILMFRMGDFYEMFFDDALKASPLLEIALTARGRGTGNEAPMCGVPHHAVDSYIARLIASGLKVAVCDQVEESGQARGLVRREVVRVVSPGTVTDPGALDARENLYIGCILPSEEAAGAAFVDLSTGELRVAEPAGRGHELALLMAAFRPREILVPEGTDPEPLLDGAGDPAPAAGTLPSWSFGRDAAWRAVLEQMGTITLEGFGCQEMDLGVRAAGALLHHLRATQRSALAHIRRIVPHRTADHMVLDAPTLRSLEVVRSLADGGRAGSLLSVLDRTLTSMGARLLQRWLVSPPRDEHVVRARHEAVGELLGDERARETLRGLLKPVRDVERLLGRATLGTANARDLVALRDSLAPLPAVRDLAARLGAPLLTGRPGPLASADTAAPPGSLDAMEDLHAALAGALEDEPPAGLKDGGIIRAGHDAALDDLRTIARDAASHIAAIETRERQRSGINSLKVRYNRVFGYSIEVSRANLALVPPDYERRQTLVNAERFVTRELKEMEEKILTARERSTEIEHGIFCRLRDAVAAHGSRLKASAQRIAELDVLASLAEVAAARGYVRPEITSRPRTRIVAGRHPIVEAVRSQERFVPNDTTLGGDGARILIVTGPNMGGKSTYLRQVALISLMAQAGSFVPAEAAEIGLADRIFSRIGSSDNLAGGQSTFMVEMQETANILHNATPLSLVLLDEVGRGTSTFDGLSLAWAIVESLRASCGTGGRVLFATHYHELTDLSATLADVRNLTVAVEESGHDVVFLRRIVEGSADRSYGLHVARLAGLPPGVIERAREVLANLETNELGGDGLPKLARHRPAGGREAAGAGQMPLFGAPEDPAASEVAEAIRRMDPDALTPLEALTALHRLRRRLRGDPE
ncbi:MAG TPA: DNA mismatch repair protein MutS [Candidatus Polarisedimenticolia bacterium]|nr:DNA mismatch repair protein MutS [Candidatus Polarisedimenticolia bacterium]